MKNTKDNKIATAPTLTINMRLRSGSRHWVNSIEPLNLNVVYFFFFFFIETTTTPLMIWIEIVRWLYWWWHDSHEPHNAYKLLYNFSILTRFIWFVLFYMHISMSPFSSSKVGKKTVHSIWIWNWTKQNEMIQKFTSPGCTNKHASKFNEKQIAWSNLNEIKNRPAIDF